MIDDHFGLRVRELRTLIFKESQGQFCNSLNKFIKIHYNKEYKELFFTQPTLSLFENENKLALKKFILLINFLYIKRNINPGWFILKNNNLQPKYSKSIEIDDTLVDIQKNLEKKYEEMYQDINSIKIIIDNSAFKV